MNALVRILSLPATLLARVPGCAPLVRACATSVGQKILMAITGLALCGFLLTHLGGNLLLYAGAEKFNHYAETLHSYGPLLSIAEIGLFAIFAAHLGLAVSTTAMNRAARQKGYRTKGSKQGAFVLPGGGASTWMVVTGILIFLFLALHITDMKLKADPLVDYTPAIESGEDQPHVNEFLAVRQVLMNPVNAVAYLVSLVALGIHLSHGFRSALQTIGINHSRWNPLLKLISPVFAWAIAGGFISLVVWAWAAPR